MGSLHRPSKLAVVVVLVLGAAACSREQTGVTPPASTGIFDEDNSLLCPRICRNLTRIVSFDPSCPLEMVPEDCASECEQEVPPGPIGQCLAEATDCASLVGCVADEGFEPEPDPPPVEEDAGPLPMADSGPGVVDSGVGVPDSGGGEILCTDTCPSAMDAACDDGGEGSMFSICELGTDCSDCGPRF